MFAKRFPLIALLSALCFLPEPGQADKQPLDVRVMSYNIRYGTAQDGENHWDKRKDFLVETIQAFDPDLLGTQETLGFQRDYLAGKLPRYEVLGVGRDDGGETGEMTALYFKRDRFDKLDGGHFWLSDTPDFTSPLRDAYRLKHPERKTDEGTFSRFKAGAVSGPRIDWIGVSAEWQVLDAFIDGAERGGRTPSDHFAVTAILRPVKVESAR